MHLTSYITLLFHGAFLILSHKMPPTGLDGYTNIFLYFHMHHYCGCTAIPPVYDFTLWLVFKLRAVLAALPCLHSWDTRLLNCAQRSRTTWCRAKRGARDSAMCERAQHSPAQCASMVNHKRWAGARTRAAVRHPERQLQGPEMENQPPSPPLIPHSQHSTSRAERAYNNSQCGGGELWECCVLILCTHLLFKLELSEPNSLHDLSSCCLTSSSKSISPINYYWIQYPLSV